MQHRCEPFVSVFADKSSLHRHNKLHTGEKPYGCETSGAAFSERHIKIHTVDKPYKCDTCNITYTQSSHVRVCMILHTENKPFKCETCGASFPYIRSLQRHAKKLT
ncbi:ZN678-like protein, partial [Mya arenaria]